MQAGGPWKPPPFALSLSKGFPCSRRWAAKERASTSSARTANTGRPRGFRGPARLIHIIPVIPVIHRPGPRNSVCRDSDPSANVLPVAGRGPSGNGETLPGTAPRRAAEVFGRKLVEAGSGQPEGRSARRRRKPKPNPLSFEGPAEPEAPGRKEPRKDDREASLLGRPIGNRNSKPQGREGRSPPGNRSRPQGWARDPQEPEPE